MSETDFRLRARQVRAMLGLEIRKTFLRLRAMPIVSALNSSTTAAAAPSAIIAAFRRYQPETRTIACSYQRARKLSSSPTVVPSRPVNLQAEHAQES